MIGSNVVLPPYSRISACPLTRDKRALSAAAEFDSRDDFDDLVEEKRTLNQANDPSVIWDVDIVGKDGIGVVAVGEEESTLNSIHPNLSEFLRGKRVVLDEAEVELNEKSNDSIEVEEDPDRFQSEIIATLKRGEEKKLDIESIIVETLGLKTSCNASFADYTSASLLGLYALVNPPLDPNATKPDKKQQIALGKLLNKWKTVFPRFISHESDQMQMIHGMEQAALCNHAALILFRYALQFFYDAEILHEEVILQFSQECMFPEILENAKEFIDWLKADEENSDQYDE